MPGLTVVQLLPALHSGGVERTTLEIGEALVRAGHRSIVVSAGGRLVAPLEASGSIHVTLDIGRKSLRTLGRVPALRRLFEQWKPDVVHARSRLPAWLAWLALHSRRGPRPHFVTSVHGLNSPGMYSGILTRGERVICVSPTVRAHVLMQWPRTPEERLRVIEPGIDPLLFASASGADADANADANADADADVWDWPGKAGEKLLLMPGRGTRLKGHVTAIELLAGLRAAGVESRLWLLGTLEPGREAYVSQLRDRARELAVEPWVSIDPPTRRMASAYARSDLVLQLSSRPEAFGRTVVEALAMGKPVAGWAHGGVGELLQRYFPEGAVALNDPVRLLDVVRGLLGNAIVPSRQMSHTLAAMQAQTLEVYESIAR